MSLRNNDFSSNYLAPEILYTIRYKSTSTARDLIGALSA